MSRHAYETANSLLAAAREVGLDEGAFHQLPGWRAAKLLDQVLDTFTRTGRSGRMRYWIWEDLRSPFLSFHDGFEIELLATLGSASSPVWLIAEDSEASKRGAPFWLFEATLGVVPRVLLNHHFLEFYVVSRDVSWLVAQNHHGAWFAAGDHAVASLR